MAVIFIASSIPNLTHIPGDVSDKTAHFAAYAILGALMLRARVAGLVDADRGDARGQCLGPRLCLCRVR